MASEGRLLPKLLGPGADGSHTCVRAYVRGQAPRNGMLRYVGGYGVARRVLKHNNIGHFEYTRGGGIGRLRLRSPPATRRLRPPAHPAASAPASASHRTYVRYVRTYVFFLCLISDCCGSVSDSASARHPQRYLVDTRGLAPGKEDRLPRGLKFLHAPPWHRGGRAGWGGAGRAQA